MKSPRRFANRALRIWRKRRSSIAARSSKIMLRALRQDRFRRAEPDRRKGLLLAHFDFALAREFERRREGGRARAPAHVGGRRTLQAESVESRPIGLAPTRRVRAWRASASDQTSRALKRTRASA